MKLRTVRDVAVVIRDRRKGLGWTQAQLATKIGVGREWVIQCEKGKSTVEWGIVFRALRALGLAVELTPEVEDADSSQDELAQILSVRSTRGKNG